MPVMTKTNITTVKNKTVKLQSPGELKLRKL